MSKDKIRSGNGRWAGRRGVGRMNPRRETKTQSTNQEVYGVKLIFDHGLFSSFEGQQGTANGQELRGFSRDAPGFGRLDSGSHACFTSSRPPSPWTSVFQFLPFFLHDVWP